MNSPAEESFPLYAPDGRLYFIRSLYPGNIGGARAGQDIWYSERLGDEWSAPTNAMGRLNNAFNNGVVGIADGGRVLYLNSTYSNKLDYQVGLSRSEFKEGEWTRPKRVRIRGFNPKHDFMSFYVDEDNNIMLLSFAKEDPSNEDLYFSRFDGKKWTRPRNLGPQINSPGADFAPYLSEDGRIVYFTSTGRDGPGGADVYMSRRLDDTWERWSEPIALPEPINSPGYDAYFTLKGTEAFFSSNRDQEFSDLYVATYEERTFDRDQDPKLADASYPFSKFVGFLGDYQENEKKEVKILNEEGEVIRELVSDENGSFIVEDLENDEKYSVRVENGLRDQPSVYFQDDTGEKTYLYQEIEDGTYPFEVYKRKIRAIQSATVVDVYHEGPSRFILRADSSLFENAEVSLIDRSGKRVERVNTASDGSFTLESLLINMLYSIKIEPDTLQSAGLEYVLREGTTELSPLILKGAPFRKLGRWNLPFVPG